MALCDKIATNLQPRLRDGERIQALFIGQKLSGWWALLSYLVMFRNRYYAVAATDQRIVVFDCGKWSMTSPKSELRSLPRDTPLGAPSGVWWKCTTLGDPMWIHKRFHKDIVQADAARGTGAAPGSAFAPPALG